MVKIGGRTFRLELVVDLKLREENEPCHAYRHQHAYSAFAAIFEAEFNRT